jgi:hypothetical protein
MRLRGEMSSTDRSATACPRAIARLSPAAHLRVHPPGPAGPVPLFQ